MSAAIDSSRNNHLDSVVAFLSACESACWQSCAQKYSCLGLSHSTTTDTSVRILHFASYRFLHEQISSFDCSLFFHSISLSEILNQATYRTWWKHIDPIGPTVSCFPYSSLFPLHWQSPTRFQPVSLTSPLAESIQEHLVWPWQCGAVGFLKSWSHCMAQGWIHRLSHSRLRSRLDYPNKHTS